jgi:hypothetical protein
MSRLLKEPLLHFLLLGALLFAVSGATGPGDSGASDRQIVVSEGRIAQLAEIFGKTWQRPPTADELKGLIDDFILEEIYYREALAMGLDRDDTVIRRRMRQKIEFLTDDAAALVEPGEEELEAYLAANAERFRRDDRYTFRQVYINPERHGDGVDGFVARQLAALREGRQVTGDSGMLAGSFEASPSRVVDSTFGTGFSGELDKLEPGTWQGPVKSGLGLHLVLLESATPGSVPKLDAIRRTVEREWANDKRQDSRKEFNDKLLENYEVVIEWPEKAPAEEAPGS